MLKNYNNNGLELVIDELSGEVFASISGAARILDISKQALSKKVGVNQMTLKTAEVLTPGGLQGVNLFNEDQLSDLIDQYKPQLWREFGKLGMRLTLQRSVNFEMSSHSVLAEVDKAVDKLFDRNTDHRPAHNAFTNWCRVYGFEISSSAKTVVTAVTGIEYNELMNGVERGTAWSVDTVTPQHVDAITRLKLSLANSQRKKGETLEQVVVRVAKRDRLLLVAQ